MDDQVQANPGPPPDQSEESAIIKPDKSDNNKEEEIGASGDAPVNLPSSEPNHQDDAPVKADESPKELATESKDGTNKAEVSEDAIKSNGEGDYKDTDNATKDEEKEECQPARSASSPSNSNDASPSSASDLDSQNRRSPKSSASDNVFEENNKNPKQEEQVPNQSIETQEPLVKPDVISDEPAASTADVSECPDNSLESSSSKPNNISAEKEAEVTKTQDQDQKSDFIELQPPPKASKSKSSSGRVSTAELKALQADLPNIEPPLPTRTNRIKDANLYKPLPGKDTHCWNCHDSQVQFSCIDCARSFHIKCVNSSQTSSVFTCARQRINESTPYIPGINWTCHECNLAQDSIKRMADGRHALTHLSRERLNELLDHAWMTVSNCADGRFLEPVRKDDLPDYYSIIKHPMDMSIIRKKISHQEYGSAEAFISDIKWIHHNCWIYNEKTHALTKNAQYILKVARSEISEIEICDSCFSNYFLYTDKWFVEPCTRPHLLVWARLKGYPPWPAKIMRIDDKGQADTRFFGAHDKARVPVDSVFIMSEEYPWAFPRSGKQKFDEAMAELNTHLVKVKAAHPDKFYYAPPKTPFNPSVIYYGVSPSVKVTKSAVSATSSAQKRVRDSSDSASTSRDKPYSADSDDEDNSLQIDIGASGAQAKRPKPSAPASNSRSGSTTSSSSKKKRSRPTPGNKPAVNSNQPPPVRDSSGRFVPRGSAQASPSSARTSVSNTPARNSKPITPVSRQNSATSNSQSPLQCTPGAAVSSISNQPPRSPTKKLDINKLANIESTKILQRKISERLGVLPPDELCNDPSAVTLKTETKPSGPANPVSPTRVSKDPIASVKKVIAKRKSADSDSLNSLSPPHTSDISINPPINHPIKRRASIEAEGKSMLMNSPTHGSFDSTNHSFATSPTPSNGTTHTTSSNNNPISPISSAQQRPKSGSKTPKREVADSDIEHLKQDNELYRRQIAELNALLAQKEAAIKNMARNHAGEIERLNRTHTQDMTVALENKDIAFEDLCQRRQRALVDDLNRKHRLELDKLRSQHVKEMNDAISDTKLKQWCAYCRKEASLYCCWNTSYCGYECQHGHWPAHMRSCQQHQAQQAAAAAAAASQGYP